MFFGQARQLCPNLQPIPYDFEAYHSVSQRLYDTVARLVAEFLRLVIIIIITRANDCLCNSYDVISQAQQKLTEVMERRVAGNSRLKKAKSPTKE